MTKTIIAGLGGVGIAVDRGWHAIDDYECSRRIAALVGARPKVDFAGLREGRVYHKKSDYGREDLFLVRRVTPSGKQAQVARPDDGRAFTVEDKIYAGSYSGSCFVELDETLVVLLGVTHEAMVERALALGLPIPPRVRCLYPARFVDVPERFARDQSDVVEKYRRSPAEDAALRVRENLVLSWGASWRGGDRATAAMVDEWIAGAHRELEKFRGVLLPRVALNADVRHDLDRQVEKFADAVDFYRWLRPFVDRGGAFCCEAT